MFPARTSAARLSTRFSPRSVPSTIRQGRVPTSSSSTTKGASNKSTTSTSRRTACTTSFMYNRTALGRGALLQTAQIILDTGIRVRLGAESSLLAEGIEGDEDGT